MLQGAWEGILVVMNVMHFILENVFRSRTQITGFHQLAEFMQTTLWVGDALECLNAFTRMLWFVAFLSRIYEEQIIMRNSICPITVRYNATVHGIDSLLHFFHSLVALLRFYNMKKVFLSCTRKKFALIKVEKGYVWSHFERSGLALLIGESRLMFSMS